MDPLKISQALIAVYGRYEEYMLGWLGKRISSATLTEDMYHARRIADELADEASSMAIRIMDLAADEAIGSVLVKLDGPRTAPTVSPAVYHMLGELGQRLDNVHQAILRTPDDIYRQTVALGSAQSILEGQPLKVRHRRIWQQFVENGITGFTDESGRNWNLVSYVEMASRSSVASAYRAQQDHTLLENDVNLATIVTTSDACETCASWSGKIIALDGLPPGRKRLWSPITGKNEDVTIHATKQQAIEDGLWHPICQCTQVAHFPGDAKPTPTPYNESEHKARMKQRYHERKIRQLKREALADPEFDYSARIKHHQTQIRSLVDNYQLSRKREREQINFGYKAQEATNG